MGILEIIVSLPGYMATERQKRLAKSLQDLVSDELDGTTAKVDYQDVPRSVGLGIKASLHNVPEAQQGPLLKKLEQTAYDFLQSIEYGWGVKAEPA